MSAAVGKIEAISQEFEWKIPNFSLLRKKWNALHSPEFEFLGRRWSMELFTGFGFEGCILCIKKTFDGFSRSDFLDLYTLGIKCFDGTIYKSVNSVYIDSDFSKNMSTPPEEYVFPRSICLPRLQRDKKKIAPHNVLTVFCNLSVKRQYYETTTAESTTQTEISGGINNLGKNLKDLLTSGEDSDLVMKVGDKDFRAHRAILRARSTVFASMFRHDMKERDSGTVDITDCDPQTFAQFLVYVYTGKVDRLDSENACQLYQVADKYDIQDLKAECLEYMEKNLSMNNFCDVITLALRHNESTLLESATQFFVKNAKKIVVTVSWFHFMKENPSEANELTQRQKFWDRGTHFYGVKRNIVLMTGWPGFWELYVENRVQCSLDCLAKYTFGIVCSDGSIYKTTSGTKKVQQWNSTWRTESLCLSDLQQDKAKIAPQNVLTIFCNVSVNQQYRKTATADCIAQTEISEDINKLEKDFKDLLTSGEDSDVAMIVGDRVFRAHRAILRARSTVFASMFGQDMNERSCGTVTIADCDQETFHHLLLFVYTGKMDRLASENACQLYQVADKYDVQDLKAECVMYMEKNLSTGNFCDVISLALRHKESDLTESATQIFLKNAMQIVGTDCFSDGKSRRSE